MEYEQPFWILGHRDMCKKLIVVYDFFLFFFLFFYNEFGCLWYLPTLEFGLRTFMGIIHTLKLNKINFALLVHCVLDAISNDFWLGMISVSLLLVIRVKMLGFCCFEYK